MKEPTPHEPKRAVALRYDASATAAPRIVAKGNAEIAQQIVQRAQASGIPIHQDPDLVALLAASDLGEEIPREVYACVAQLLAWLWSLRAPVTESQAVTPS